MMTHAEIENHREVSDILLRQAMEEFEASDLIQASEKAWGGSALSESRSQVQEMEQQ